MKIINKFLIVLSMVILGTVGAKAASVGVTYEMATIDGNGTEYVIDGATSNKNTGSNSKDVDIASVFIETNTLDHGFRLGFEWIPANAEFVNRSATQTNITDADSTTESKTQIVKGEFQNHMTLYVEKDIYKALYIKGGVSQVDIKSLENVGTGSQYPDDTINGFSYGIGLRKQYDNGLLLKAEYSASNYKTIKLNSSNTSNKVEGDLDSVSGRISVGYNF